MKERSIWLNAKLGEISREIKPGYPSGKHNSVGNGKLHFRPYNISNEGEVNLTQTKFVPLKNEDYYLKSQDIIFNNTNSPELLGKTCIINKDTDWVYSNHMTRIRLKPRFDPRFYARYLHYLKYTGFYKVNCSNHVNQASIASGFLNQNLEVPICPLPEQRAIVSKIEQLFSELDNGIANLKLAQEQLKVYRQAVLKKAFEGYVKVPFSDLVKSSQNGISKRSGKEGSEFKVLRLADISNLEIDYSSPRCIRLTSSEINKYKLFKDDLVCIRVNGSKNLVGRLIITSKKDDLNNWAFCDHFIRFSLDLSNTVPKYYYYYFQTMEVRQYVHENMVSSAGQNTVSQSTIKSILVPFCSLPEQQVIVQEIETRLSVCDKIEQDIETNLERAEALRQSILKKAFEGKLLNEKELAEVRGAEDWEPAEVLLERIKAEKVGNRKKRKQTTEKQKNIIQEDKGLIQQATLQAFEQIDK
ncbi:hypothetical protein A9239_08025 [Methanosarcina sp. A14]|uniref:Type I restriction-modification system, specificity subunit S n=1 Tax=Methanosarcina barkeri MS TaxID=1434108 RepID=A0A0E3QSE9_METBA|nr:MULTISPECIES: restriction endonuclease subunit S [Methanosarcina]AKB53373.1 Type I restriction-modification system, specificity subunit S [Methanosarcina barkeri MS]OED09790.1 hypothetical protein A9239_08025 [Methanosarcina sp. A14]